MRICSTVLLSLLLPAIAVAASKSARDLYLDGSFAEAAAAVESVPATERSAAEIGLLAECRARLGEHEAALAVLAARLAAAPDDPELLAGAAAIAQFGGEFERAHALYDRAVAARPDEARALLGLATLELTLRHPDAALAAWRRAGQPGVADRPLYRRVGALVHAANLDPAVRRSFALGTASREGGGGRAAATATMLAQASGRLFASHGEADRVELPVADFAPDTPYKCLVIELGGRSFKVLLDTGNAPLWTVHAPELLELLPTVRGAGGSVQTGSVDTALESFDVLTREIAVGDWRLTDLAGVFFAKPRETYFDANLNPLAIRDRVVTIDFVHDRLILASSARFAADLASVPPARVTRLPLYGLRWSFVPAGVGAAGHAALAHVETGAEDVAIARTFAQQHHMPLSRRTVEWRGKPFEIEETEAAVWLGAELLHRPAAPVFAERFADPIGGKWSDVMVGPAALEDRYAVSFDPFANELVLIRGGLPPGGLTAAR